MTRYSDVCLLAAGIKDDVLIESLRDLYLAPLERGPAGGRALRATLRAYFAARSNASSAAAALAVTRQTVTKRLRRVEEELGIPLESCARELELALELDDLMPVG